MVEASVLTGVRRNHGYDVVTLDFLHKALENEFRVRIAQLADAEYQTVTHNPRGYKRLDPSPELKSELKRIPLSPGQIWDFYQENRREFDVALLPIPVADFTKDIADPDPKKIEDLFEKAKTKPFDPASDQAGFRKPQQIRVQYVSADPNSPFFKRIAPRDRIHDRISDRFLRAADAAGDRANLRVWADDVRFAFGTRISRQSEQRIGYASRYDCRRQSVGRSRSGNGRLLRTQKPHLPDGNGGSDGSADGAFAAIPALVAQPMVEKTEMLDATRKAASRALSPYFASVVGSGTMAPGFVSCLQLDILSDYPTRNMELTRRLPLAVVRADILKGFDERIARNYVVANMAFFKKKLEEENVAGKAPQVQRELDRYRPRKPGEPAVEGKFRDLGLEIAQTENFYDRYNIKSAPELKPLLEAYERHYRMVNWIEGRDTPETALKDDDFWKLFFDPSMPFSITSKYVSRPWPPVVKLGTPTQIEFLKDPNLKLDMPASAVEDLFSVSQNREPNKDANFSLFTATERPFLFWKTEEKLSEIPETLAEVKDRVVETWKMQQARETKVLPFAKKLAQDLLAGNSDYASVLKQEGAKINQNLITFEKLAPIYREHQPGAPVKYAKYKLKRDVISYPRDDMVDQFLALYDLKEPIKTEIADLDKLNVDLFEEAKAKKLPGEKFVQVLANKPRDTFYIAVVQFGRGVNYAEFFQGALPNAIQLSDPLFDRAQTKLGAEHYRALMQQLRLDHKAKRLPGADTYDGDGGGGG